MTKYSLSLLLGGGLVLLLVLGEDLGGEVGVVLVLGLVDLDGIGHDLAVDAGADLGGLHNLDLDADHTLTELNVTDSLVDEIVLGLSSRDLVTHSVLLGLGALSTDLSADDDFATDGLALTHDGSHDVVGGITDGGTGEELELKVLAVGGGAACGVVGEGFDGELEFVGLVVEVVSLLDEGFDFLDLAVGLGEHLLGLGASDADLGGHGSGTDLDTGVSLFSEGAGKELVEFGTENSVSDELLLGVDFLDLGGSGHSNLLINDYQNLNELFNMRQGQLIKEILTVNPSVFSFLSFLSSLFLLF
jgi:hypothetical protein